MGIIQKLLSIIVIFILGLFFFSDTSYAFTICYQSTPNNHFDVWDYETQISPFVMNTVLGQRKVGVELNDKGSDVLGDSVYNVWFNFGDNRGWVGRNTTGDWVFKNGSSYRLDYWINSVPNYCGTKYISVRWISEDDGGYRYCSFAAQVCNATETVENPGLTDLLNGIALTRPGQYGVIQRSSPGRLINLQKNVGGNPTNLTDAECSQLSVCLTNTTHCKFFSYNPSDGTCIFKDSSIFYTNQSPYLLQLINGSTISNNDLLVKSGVPLTLKYEKYECPTSGATFVCGEDLDNTVTKVQGYVRDDSSGVGIQGAKISVHYKRTSSDPAFTIAQDVVSGTDGRWESVIPYLNLYEIQVYETNADWCAADGRNPTVPTGVYIFDSNHVKWSSPPSTAGQIVFYDGNCTDPPPDTGPFCNTVQELKDGYINYDGIALTSNYAYVKGDGDVQYTAFTAGSSGEIDAVSIWTRVWPDGNGADGEPWTADDDTYVDIGHMILQCVLTTAEGTFLGESEMNDGPFNSGDGWLSVPFVTKVPITKDTQYRLFCKNTKTAGSSQIYWRRGSEIQPKPHQLFICPASPAAWWQIGAGLVHANPGGLGVLTNAIDSEVPSAKYLISTFGGATYRSGQLRTGAGTLAPASYGIAARAGEYKGLRYDYAYWMKKISAGAGVWDGTSWPAASGIYKGPDVPTQEAVVSGVMDLNNQVVLLYNGDVRIAGNISTTANGVLVIIASGAIKIDPTVTSVQGYFLSNTFRSGISAQQLVVKGGAIGWDNVYLERDLGAGNTNPAEKFSSDPVMLHAIRNSETLKPLLVFQYSWQEVAP